MNDYIKQLAEQAGFVLWANEEWKPEDQVVDWSSNYDVELEKFAELIVRECVEVVASRPYIDDGNHSHPATMIKHHLGVE